MSERRGTKALETWCRRMTDGYPGVKVENMTTSWRDGLAFCAIIHHFRPDLIDFSKLNKDDIYYNNNLAFRVAERHLGIPALLDAEDMVEYEVPDRLSILTYLSQFYQVFVNSQGSPTRIVAKRPAVTADRGIVSPTSASPPAKMAVRNSVGITGSAGRREPCAKCGYPVFLAERLHVGTKLYHRTCFRCARCNNQLSLANCYETETDGQFCCETCPDEEEVSKSNDVTDSTNSDITQQDAKQPNSLLENNVKAKIKQFDVKADAATLDVNHEPLGTRSSSLSDEERSQDILDLGDDEYSSHFENLLEEADTKTAQEENSLTKARHNFFSTQMLHEDFDELEAQEISNLGDVEDEFESLYKELTHEDKTKVSEFDKMKVNTVETPPPLPTSKPPDIPASLALEQDVKMEPPEEPKLEELEVTQEEVIQVQETLLEEKPDIQVAKKMPEIVVHSSDKDNVKEDQQVTASDTSMEEVTKRTDKNVTKDTNRTSLVKTRMLIFENAEKPAPTPSPGKLNKKFDEPQKLEKADVPSDKDVIVISDTDSSILSTKDSSAFENSVEIISDTSALDLSNNQTDGSVVNISSEVSPATGTSVEAESISEEDQRVKVEPGLNDSVSVESSVDSKPSVDAEQAGKSLLRSILDDTSLGESRVTIDPSILESSKSDYPEELNPFGDDEEDGGSGGQSSGLTARPVPLPRKNRVEKTANNTNPFGSSDDDDENDEPEHEPQEAVTSKPPLPPQDGGRKLLKAPRVSLNPFWSDDEEPTDEDAHSKPVPLPRTSKSLTTPEPRPRRLGLSKNGDAYDSNSSLSSMSSSVSHTPGRKKKPAPPPPTHTAISPNTSKNDSPQMSPKLTPRVRKNRKAPPPPTSTPSVQMRKSEVPDISPINDNEDKFNTPYHPNTDAHQMGDTQYYSLAGSIVSVDLEKEKITKDENNRNRQSQNLSSPVSDSTSDSLQMQSVVLDKSTHGKWKRKKGPAPARPVPQRRQIKPLPLTELRRELDIIEMQQQGLEKQGVKLEQLIREKCEGPGASDETALSPEVEDLVLELFELVNEKNELFRRQAELMYLRRQQRLEEEYADLEYQIRCLMDRPERNKTDSDKAREEELINRLVEVVERRNEIVECLEMDRVREAEEDQSINSRLNLIAAKREEETQSLSETPVKLSKKEKKKMKKEKKLKDKGKPLDVDKDIDESESSLTSIKEKKKKKWF